MINVSTNNNDDQKIFTLESANETLPLVRVIVRDIVELANDMIDRRGRLDFLKQGRDADQDDVYGEELDDIEQHLKEDSLKLRNYVDELEELGVVIKSITEGLVDFPAELSGRPIELCWKYNEPEIGFWHELEAGFAGRRSVDSLVTSVGPTEDEL